ncbi:hypothetical protein KI387_024851, partial [Taxus chinensis]
VGCESLTPNRKTDMEKSKVAKSRSMSSAPSGHNHEDWNCNMVKPLRFNKCGFNVFSKVSSKRFIEGVPIYLNVYDLTTHEW